MREENKEIFISPQGLRETPTDDLENLIAETRQKMLEMRTQEQLSGKIRAHELKGYRRLIARTKTILRERTSALAARRLAKD